MKKRKPKRRTWRSPVPPTGGPMRDRKKEASRRRARGRVRDWEG